MYWSDSSGFINTLYFSLAELFAFHTQFLLILHLNFISCINIHSDIFIGTDIICSPETMHVHYHESTITI